MKPMDKSSQMFRLMMDIPHQQVSQCIKLELLLERSKWNELYSLFWNQSIYLHRRDFRQAKVDPTTGKVVPNPVKWVEMKENIEIVRKYFHLFFTHMYLFSPRLVNQ